MKSSTLLTLFDNEPNRKNEKDCLSKLEVMVDDPQNPDIEFWENLDEEIEWGKTYKLTIEEVKAPPLDDNDKLVAANNEICEVISKHLKALDTSGGTRPEMNERREQLHQVLKEIAQEFYDHNIWQ